MLKTKKKKSKKEKKTNIHVLSSELYNNFLEIYYDKYNELSDEKRSKIDLNMILKFNS